MIVIGAVEEPVPLPTVTDATLTIGPHVTPAVVAETTWMSMCAPEARVAKVHDRVCEPTAPVIEQPAGVLAGDSDQLRPCPPGSASVTTTFVAVPGPALDT